MSDGRGATAVGGRSGAGAPRDWAERVSHLLEEQCGLCEQLDELSRRQGGLIESGDTDAVLGVLGERQVVIDRVAVLGGELDPLREQGRAMLPQLPAPVGDAINRRVERIAALIDGVRSRDETDRAAMEQRRSEIADELSGLSRGRGAVSAYGGPVANAGPKFQDRKG